MPLSLGTQAPSVGPSERKQGRASLSPRDVPVRTHSVPLAAHHAALDVAVILLEELVVGHLQLCQLPPEEKELVLETHGILARPQASRPPTPPASSSRPQARKGAVRAPLDLLGRQLRDRLH